VTGDGRETADDAAWDEVVRQWADDAAHRAFLAARPGMEGLADAGRRYRDALARRPGDPVALRWRDEVLRRAAALAFAQLPRTRPPPAFAGLGRRRVFAAGVVLALLVGAALVLLRVPGFGR
jgi:hypothetical protein